jgi:hypothetical protein
MRQIHLFSISNALLFLLLWVGNGSCKKDTGNYDYIDIVMPSVANAGLEANYTIKQNADFIIHPVVDYAGDTSNLQYRWITYVRGLISPAGIADTISTAKNLNVKLTHVPGTYYVELIVIDTQTGVRVNTRANLTVSAGMESGWLVLHSTQQKSEVDFIVSTAIQANAVPSRERNLFTSTQGAPLDGVGRFISQTRRASSDFNFINVGTSTHFQRNHGFTFRFINKDQQLFRRALPSMQPQAHVANSTYEFYINDGQLYTGVLSTIQDSYYTGPFRGNYYLEPHMTFHNYNIYGALVYDRQARKFQYTTANTNTELNLIDFRAPVTGSLFDLRDMKDSLLYMETGFQNHSYAFFKKATGAAYRLVAINVSKADDGNLAVADYDLSYATAIDQARFFDVGSIGPVALYATDKRIYRLDYLGGASHLMFDGFEPNETITSMKLFKAYLNANNTPADFQQTNNTVLYVATWNGTEGKVYEFAINPASGVLNPTPLQVYHGFGQVKDMAFKFRAVGN